MAEHRPERRIGSRLGTAKCVAAIIGALLLASTSGGHADDRSHGSAMAPESPAEKSDVVHYRLIREPAAEATGPAREDFVRAPDIPRPYLKAIKPPAGSTETTIGVEIEAFYPEMTPLSGTYPPGRPRITIEMGTASTTTNNDILRIIEFLKGKGMKHTRDRDDLCGYAMPEKLPGFRWFIPCNEHASVVALITCGSALMCSLQAALHNGLGVHIGFPEWLLGESFAIRDAVARLTFSFEANSVAPPATSQAAPPRAGAKPETANGSVAGSDDSTALHFKLLGPEWEDWPAGYSGQIPETVIAELSIPREYVAADPATDRTSSILIQLSYPSMKGAVGQQSSEARINAIISATAGKSRPIGPPLFSFRFMRGKTREPRLDVNGLCGYVDTQHPGSVGVEFYVACDESRRSFQIFCSPEFNHHRPCSDSAFLGGHIRAQISYQIGMLKERDAIMEAVRKLVLSFEQPLVEQAPRDDPKPQ